MAQQALTLERQITRTVRLGYLLYLPKDYAADPSRRWPLILFLHGAGERGNDLEQVKIHGIPKVAERLGLPFIAISPQCPPDTWWSDHVDALDLLLDDVTANYAVDTARVYLTGLSMGGFGTWHLATIFPERFAAIAPICGGGAWFAGFPARAALLKSTPVWAFHGARDPVVPLDETQKLVDVLREAGGDVRLTVYPEAGHDAWSETYDNPELYTWFLAHRR